VTVFHAMWIPGLRFADTKTTKNQPNSTEYGVKSRVPQRENVQNR